MKKKGIRQTRQDYIKRDIRELQKLGFSLTDVVGDRSIESLAYTKKSYDRYRKHIRALKNKKVRKELSKYQDGKRVVNNYATKMRENPTKAEDSFSKELDKNGISYRQQVVIDCKVKKYIADFVVGKTVIEVDGGAHHKPKAVKYDAVRTDRLESLGYSVLRIDNKDVIKKSRKLNELIRKLKN